MEQLKVVASYVYSRYSKEYSMRIDEMKLHKLLYFAQRESLVQSGQPLFEENFYGWKFGPILKEVREMYKENDFLSVIKEDTIVRLAPVVDVIFKKYAEKDPWSLSRLTHGELSWKNSRVGIPDGANSDNPIRLEDIAKDAERIRCRRKMLEQLKLA